MYIHYTSRIGGVCICPGSLFGRYQYKLYKFVPTGAVFVAAAVQGKSADDLTKVPEIMTKSSIEKKLNDDSHIGLMAKAILCLSGWTDNDFAANSITKDSLADVRGKLCQARAATIDFLNLDNLITSAGTNQVVTEPQKLRPLSWIKALTFQAHTCETEDEVKSILKMLVEPEGTMCVVFQRVEKTRKELINSVETFDRNAKVSVDKKAKEEEQKKAKL